MTNEQYQGWPNKETWIVNLYLNHEQPMYEYWRAVAKVCIDSEQMMGVAKNRFAAEMRDDYNEKATNCVDPMFGELAKAALARVDWYRIAERFMEGMQ